MTDTENRISKLSDQDLSDIYRYIIELGASAHKYGMSSIKLTNYLKQVVRKIGLRGEFMVTPDFINYIFWQEGEIRQFYHYEKMPPAAFDMNKLAMVVELVDNVLKGKYTIKEGIGELKRISEQKPLYGKFFYGIGFILSGAGFAVLLSAKWSDVLTAAMISLAVYFITLLSERSRWIKRSKELISALTASVLASIYSVINPGSDSFTTTLCALIVLVPGLSLTFGIGEISAKYLVSGFQRLTDGIMITFKLFIGAVIGSYIVSAFYSIPPAVEPVPYPEFWKWIFLLALIFGLAFVFQVRKEDYLFIILGGLLTFSGILFGGEFGYWQGSFYGALLLGIFAGIYSMTLNRSSSIIIITDIMILVPGASAYLGLHEYQNSGAASGLTAEWKVFVNIIAILSGLLVAISIMPRKVVLS